MLVWMDSAERPRLSEDEYLALERESVVKSEYFRGEIVAMAGASMRHNLIVGNLVGALRELLKSEPCVVLPSDQRVHVPSTELYTYPDVTILCDAPRSHPKDEATLLNPSVLVEVLSDSTEAYDRGAKFAHYRHIESLEEYVLVAQREPRVEHYQRLETGQWLLTALELGDSLKLPALGVELPLAEIYAKLDLLD